MRREWLCNCSFLCCSINLLSIMTSNNIFRYLHSCFFVSRANTSTRIISSKAFGSIWHRCASYWGMKNNFISTPIHPVFHKHSHECAFENSWKVWLLVSVSCFRLAFVRQWNYENWNIYVVGDIKYFALATCSTDSL